MHACLMNDYAFMINTISMALRLRNFYMLNLAEHEISIAHKN